MTTEKLAEALGWREVPPVSLNEGWLYTDQKGRRLFEQHHQLSPTCWHCAGLVVEEMERRGFGWYLGRSVACFWPNGSSPRVSDGSIETADNTLTACFAAACAALGVGLGD